MSFPEIIAKLPEIGTRGLYRGSIPAILGQFSRFVIKSFFIFSATFLYLENISFICALTFSIIE
jgi:hypothetical protein